MKLHTINEEHFIIERINEFIRKQYSQLRNRKEIFKLPNKDSSVILLVSGGLDSILLWAYLILKYKLHVYPLYIASNLQSKQSIAQLESLFFYSDIYNKKYPKYHHDPYIVQHNWLFSFSNFKKRDKYSTHDLPLLVNNISHDDYYNSYALGVSGTPSRWFVYSYYGYEYALKLRYLSHITVNDIIFGVLAEDQEFLSESSLATLKSINLSLCLTLQDFKWRVYGANDKSIDFYLSKKDLLLFARSASINAKYTRSCGNNTSIHCGECPSCYARIKAYQTLKIPDPTIYLNKEKFRTNISQKFKTIILQYLRYTLSSLAKIKTFIMSKKIQSNTLIMIKSNIYAYETNKEFYIYNKNKGYIEELNESGSYLWKLIQENKKISMVELSNKLNKKYNISSKQSQQDTVAFLVNYANLGYLQFEK